MAVSMKVLLVQLLFVASVLVPPTAKRFVAVAASLIPVFRVQVKQMTSLVTALIKTVTVELTKTMLLQRSSVAWVHAAHKGRLNAVKGSRSIFVHRLKRVLMMCCAMALIVIATANSMKTMRPSISNVVLGFVAAPA